MSSVFTKIINGEIPCLKLAENDLFIAFMDIQPLRRGHVLVVPKQEIDKFYQADNIYLQNWFLFAKPIANAIEKAIPCKRVGMSIIGLEVPHAHMHLVPINDADDLNFSQKPLAPSPEDLAHVHELIVAALV